MDSYRKYVVKKQRKERREHWVGVAREFAAIAMWGVLIFLFLVFIAPHLP